MLITLFSVFLSYHASLLCSNHALPYFHASCQPYVASKTRLFHVTQEFLTLCSYFPRCKIISHATQFFPTHGYSFPRDTQELCHATQRASPHATLYPTPHEYFPVQHSDPVYNMIISHATQLSPIQHSFSHAIHLFTTRNSYTFFPILSHTTHIISYVTQFSYGHNFCTVIFHTFTYHTTPYNLFRPHAMILFSRQFFPRESVTLCNRILSPAQNSFFYATLFFHATPPHSVHKHFRAK